MDDKKRTAIAALAITVIGFSTCVGIVGYAWAQQRAAAPAKDGIMIQMPADQGQHFKALTTDMLCAYITGATEKCPDELAAALKEWAH